MFKKGFSLLEIMVATAVFALIIGSAGGLFVSVQRAWQRQKAMIDLVQNARQAMEFMTNEIRMADTSINPNASSLSLGQSIRFYLAKPSESKPWWYWRGDSSSDASGFGNISTLYRGEGENLNQAYATRQQIANFIVAVNPDFVNNSTGFPLLPPPSPGDGSDPIFIYNNNLLTIELTVRSNPTQAESSINRSYTLRTQVRPRNK